MQGLRIVLAAAAFAGSALLVQGCSGGSTGGGVVAAPASTTSGATPASTAPAATATTANQAFVPAGTQVQAGPLFDIAPDYIAVGGDPVMVPARVESDMFTDRLPSAVPPYLRVVTWNVHRGEDALAALNELQTNPLLASADFIFLQECARDDTLSVPSRINFAREAAQLLNMDYVYAAEWDFRYTKAGRGEQGNAILSKYPLGNVRQIRHRSQISYYLLNRRLGGWLTLAADAMVGGTLVRLYNAHLEVGDIGAGRAVQMAEVRADANLPGQTALQIVGGDFNSFGTKAMIKDLENDGWANGLPGNTDYTHKAGILKQRLDWLFYRGGIAPVGPFGVEQQALGSDHYPTWFEFTR